MNIIKAPIKRILLIDDDQDDCSIFELALQEISSTIKLTCLHTCEEVIKNLNKGAVDLIFLDINLPKITGFECLSDIQNSAQHSRIPIVMYSSSNRLLEINRAYGYGAALYFRKPSRYPDLVESLKGILLLDWDRPELITEKYFQNGRFKQFEL